MEMLFILDAERDLRRRPDVAFVSADRWPLDRELPVTGANLAKPHLYSPYLAWHPNTPPPFITATTAAKIFDVEKRIFVYDVEKRLFIPEMKKR